MALFSESLLPSHDNYIHLTLENITVLSKANSFDTFLPPGRDNGKHVARNFFVCLWETCDNVLELSFPAAEGHWFFRVLDKLHPCT